MQKRSASNEDSEIGTPEGLLRSGEEPLWPLLKYLQDWRCERALIEAEFELARNADLAHGAGNGSTLLNCTIQYARLRVRSELQFHGM